MVQSFEDIWVSFYIISGQGPRKTISIKLRAACRNKFASQSSVLSRKSCCLPQGPSLHSQTAVNDKQRVTRSHQRANQETDPGGVDGVAWLRLPLVTKQLLEEYADQSDSLDVVRGQKHVKRRPRAPGQALLPSPEPSPPIPFNILGKYGRWAEWGRVAGRLCVNLSPKAAAPPQLPRKLSARCAKRKAGGRSPHLILERLFSSCLSTPPPPQISIAREQDGSCPQEIKILNGSISCQALSPATKVGSVPVKSPQVRGLQVPLCVSSEVSPLNSRGQWERVLRPLPFQQASLKLPLNKSVFRLSTLNIPV